MDRGYGCQGIVEKNDEGLDGFQCDGAGIPSCVPGMFDSR